MNYKTVLFLVLVIMCSYTLAKMKRMEKVLQNLVQLNQAAGNSNEDISMLLSKVASHFEDTFYSQERFHEVIRQSCDNGKEEVHGFVNNLKSDVQLIDSAIIKAQNDNESAKVEMARLEEQLKVVKGDIENIQAEIEKAIEVYKTSGSEAENKLVTIKAVKDIITDELLAEQPSFVQLSTRDFNLKLSKLKNILSQMHSREAMYSSMLMTLLQVAEKKGFSDQPILMKVLDLLSKLENNTREFRKKQETTEKEIIESMRRKLYSAKENAKTLALIFGQTRSSKLENEEIIRNGESDRQDILATIARKETELEFFKKVCESQEVLRNENKTYKDNTVGSINSKINYVDDLDLETTSVNPQITD